MMMKLPSDDHHLDDEEGFQSLLDGNKTSPESHVSLSHTSSRVRHLIMAGLAAGFLTVFILATRNNLTSNSFNTHKHPPLVQYTCPSQVSKSLNDNTEDAMEWYIMDDAENENATIAQLKNASMDGWGMPYVSVKKMLRPWKEQIYVANIQSGDSIYESACGSGLNLLLTVEILREYNIRNLTIYGNDYVKPSVEIANRVWSMSNIAEKGILCQGDSSNLSFVPSDMFDFVFTGYIDPLVDPLNLSPKHKLITGINNCFSNNATRLDIARNEQQAQQDWYASWVSEMVRIAKPGKPVVVESTSESLCKHFSDFPKIHDWGGVDEEWWSRAISEYGWDVDPSSLVIDEEPRSEEWPYPRYHVFMRKNKH